MHIDQRTMLLECVGPTSSTCFI